MAGAAVVVLDPPYAGAGAQMKNLAGSAVPRIIYVSCNPDALANDAALLRRAGYGCVNATPIDQFPYSENLESVVVFAKDSAGGL
jgi:23S rRNA (uracil1939-C5)-methyltransferase